MLSLKEKVLNENVTVIIRTVGERTTSACQQAIESQGVNCRQIFVVQESPLSEALKTCYTIGIREAREWTYCVDADVILRKKAISELIRYAEKCSKSIFVVHGQNHDKFLNKVRCVGNRLYRTESLPQLIQRIPTNDLCIRPEANAVKSMRNIGLDWVIAPILVGLHDYWQYNEHIFRKCFVHAHKHKREVTVILDYWKKMTVLDEDFLIACRAHSAGLKFKNKINADANARYYRDAWDEANLTEKNPLEYGEISDFLVEDILKNKSGIFLWKVDNIIKYICRLIRRS